MCRKINFDTNNTTTIIQLFVKRQNASVMYRTEEVVNVLTVGIGFSFHIDVLFCLTDQISFLEATLVPFCCILK